MSFSLASCTETSPPGALKYIYKTFRSQDINLWEWILETNNFHFRDDPGGWRRFRKIYTLVTVFFLAS